MAKRKPTPEERATELLARKQTELSQAKFLASYAQTGNVTAACRLAEVGRRTHYDWLAKDPAYKAKFDDAVEDAADLLEVEARRRAVSGTLRPIYHKGMKVGEVKDYSDVLLIFLLKGARPEKYAERHKHSGTGKRGAFLLEDIVGGAAEGEAK